MQAEKRAPPFRVLALDGGGLRGILPATVLMALESETGQGIGQLFDLVVGTSTGGILALGLGLGGPNGTPAYTAAQLRDLYFENAEKIFPLGGMPLVHVSGAWGTRSQLPPDATLSERIGHWLGRENIHRVVSPAGGALYPAAGLEQVLATYFGEARLDNTLCGVAVTTYDYASKRTYLLRNYPTNASWELPATNQVLMREAARATSAGPTFFPPTSLTGFEGVLVDGGVTANNPAMIAYIEAQELIRAMDLPPASSPVATLLVSIGTGVAAQAADDVTLQLVERQNWVKLAHDHLMGALFTGLTELHDEQLNQLLNVVPAGEPPGYFRFQTTLQSGSFAMDDARPENLRGLLADAERMVEENRDGLLAIARRLRE